MMQKFGSNFLLGVLVLIPFIGIAQSPDWKSRLEWVDENLSNESDSAFEIIQAALNLPSDTLTPDIHQMGLMLKGKWYYFQRQTDSAKHYFSASARIARLENDLLAEGKSINNLGSVWTLKGYPDSARSCFELALLLKERAGAKNDELQKSIVNIGNTYNIQGFYELAADQYLQALALQDSSSNDRIGATLNLNLGVVFKRIGQYDKADLYYHRAIDQFSSIGSSVGVLTAQINLGSLLLDINKLEEAQDILLRALQNAKEQSDVLSEAFAALNLGQVYIAIGKFDKASSNLRHAREVFLEVGDDIQSAVSGYHLGYAEYSIGGRGGLRLLQESIELLRTQHQLINNLTALEYLREVFSKEFRYEDALCVGDSLMLYQKKLSEDEMLLKVEGMEARHELTRRKQKIALQQTQLEAAAQSAELLEIKLTQRTMIIVLLIVAIILLMMLGFFYRNRLLLKTRLVQLKAENDRLKVINLNESLKVKNRELLRLGVYFSEKNRFLMSLKNDLRQIRNKDAQAIRMRIQHYLNSEMGMDSFFDEIQLVLSTFNDQLKEDFPELTQREIRLCGLIRLGFSSKDIAALFNITPKSVDMLRYRLRKKLVIDEYDSLSGMLESRAL